MLERPGRVAGVAVVVGMLAATAAAATGGGTVSGRVDTALRPAPGFVGVARAIDVSNLTVAAAGAVTGAGRYSLKVPPGVYLVSVDRVGARTPPARGYARLVRVRSGRTATPPVVTRRPQARSSSLLYQGKPAVAIKEFQGSGPYAVFGRGIVEILMSDLATSPCIVLVEWLRRAEVIGEIERQQNPAFDPSTAVRPGRLIQPDIFVEGSVATTESSVTVAVRVRDARSGRVIGSVRASGADGFSVEERIADKLRELLEGECMPPRFEGTFTGENRTAGVNRYSGSIVFVRDASSPPEIVTYRVERVSWRHTYTAPPPCSGGGTANVSVPRPDPRLSVLVIQKQKAAQGHGYAITGMFTSPKRLTITLTCNGRPLTQPWVPGAALNTGPPGSTLAPGAGNYTDRTTIKGRYESTGTASTYTWNLRAST
jgi:hypothetical protein